MKNHLVFALLIFLIISCKKDRLKGDKEIFIGKWKWVYTETIDNTCGGGPLSSSFKTPSSTGISYSIEFLKKGKVIYYENGNETTRDRIVFERFEQSTSSRWISYYTFGIDGDNKNDKAIDGFIKQDTLILIGNSKWPHYTECPCCTVYVYFIRE